MKDKKQAGNDFKSFDDMVKAHRGVLKSLIDKDNYYKTGEAVEINNGFGKQLNFLKLMLEAHKMMGIKPEREDLFLTESIKE